MHLVVLALALALFMHDQFAGQGVTGQLTGWQLVGVVLLPKIAVGLAYWIFCKLILQRLGRGNTPRLMRMVGLAGWVIRIAVVKLFILDLYYNALTELRLFMGDWILIDEIVLLLPSLALIVGTWIAYYPIERRLREAMLLRQLDEGRPIFPVWTRRQFLISQLRHQLALVGVPVLALMAWSEVVATFGPMLLPNSISGYLPYITLVGAGGIFLVSPLIIQLVWDTQPLPAGELRDRLLALCKKYNVKVRKLLLWRTYGGMINAAVMGVMPRLRFILLTDALLESVPDDQVEAVMAHEIGHVRKYHMFWLIFAAAGLMALLQWVFGIALTLAFNALPEPGSAAAWLEPIIPYVKDQQTLQLTVVIATLLVWALMFGWISRRFERQADTFAVAHLAERDAAQSPTQVTPQAVAGMIDALQHVADLNQIPTSKGSWRHGSILWRQAYLAGLVDQPTDRLQINTVVRRINLAMAGVFIVLLVMHFYGSDLVESIGIEMAGLPQEPWPAFAMAGGLLVGLHRLILRNSTAGL